MLRLVLIPHRLPWQGRFSGGLRRTLRGRTAWRLLEVLIFVLTLLLAWALSTRVAGGGP